MAEVVGTSNAEATFRAVDIRNRIYGREIQTLHLSYNKAEQLANLKADQYKATMQLWTSSLTRKQIAAKQQVNKAEYDNKVAQLIHDKHYKHLTIYDSKEFDRRCRHKYKMNDAQIAKYKELMNNQVIAIKKVQHNPQLTRAQKQTQTANIREATLTKAGEFLTADQCSQIAKNENLLDQRRAKTRNERQKTS